MKRRIGGSGSVPVGRFLPHPFGLWTVQQSEYAPSSVARGLNRQTNKQTDGIPTSRPRKAVGKWRLVLGHLDLQIIVDQRSPQEPDEAKATLFFERWVSHRMRLFREAIRTSQFMHFLIIHFTPPASACGACGCACLLYFEASTGKRNSPASLYISPQRPWTCKPQILITVRRVPLPFDLVSKQNGSTWMDTEARENNN